MHVSLCSSDYLLRTDSYTESQAKGNKLFKARVPCSSLALALCFHGKSATWEITECVPLPYRWGTRGPERVGTRSC